MIRALCAPDWSPDVIKVHPISQHETLEKSDDADGASRGQRPFYSTCYVTTVVTPLAASARCCSASMRPWCCILHLCGPKQNIRHCAKYYIGHLLRTTSMLSSSVRYLWFSAYTCFGPPCLFLCFLGPMSRVKFPEIHVTYSGALERAQGHTCACHRIEVLR